jgi:hypothetical protein
VFNVLETNNRAEYSILQFKSPQLPSSESPDTLRNTIRYNDVERRRISATGNARSKACLHYLETT